LYAIPDLQSWINTARGQLAGEAECIRVIGTLPTVIGQRNYFFSAINTAVANGVQGVIHVRRITYNVGIGQKWIAPRSWEWFDLYHLDNPVPVNGPPAVWAQYGQGSSGGGEITGGGTGNLAPGSFYLDPPPDAVYTLNCDCVCYPNALAADSDFEAIPYLWTDAVPFFAAWYALLSAQTSARTADAERMFNYYQTFLERARRFSNPSVNRGIYQQSADMVQQNKLGLQKAAG
jgi:hypothetical protein